MADEKELGFDEEEVEVNRDVKGITGTVNRYSNSKLEYPCYVLNITKEKPMITHKMEIFKGMTLPIDTYDEELKKQAIHIYLNLEENHTMLGFGIIYPQQVKSFLNLFDTYDIDGYYTDGEKLEGMMLYTLAE